jgi:TP901 family phage tail tape measure protein
LANTIRGITVEIGGNTAPLENALQNVNRASRDIQGELKEVNKLLRLDPGNTELLKQKQELLAKSISNTSEKLETLKEAERQAQQQFAQGNISEEQYRALQREVIRTENELSNLQNQAGQCNAALNRVATVTGDIGEASTKLGKKLLPVSAGIVALGAASVAAFDEVDSGTDEIIKKTGATGEAAKDLEKIYKDVASSVPDSFEEVSAAVGETSVRLELTGDKLKAASEDFLKFAKVNGTDVSTSVQLVSRAMGDAGIKADDYKLVLDKLTVAAQKSGIGVDALAENLAKYGAPMRALGLDMNTSIALFSAWEKAGVNTEIAFSGMKKAISNWGKAGKDSGKEFAKTLEEIKKCPDLASATSKAIEVFGAKAGPDLADAIKGGRFEVTQYTEALKKSGDSVNNTYANIVDGMDDASTAVNAAKVAASDLGNTVMTMLAPVLQGLAAKARDVASWFSGLSDTTKTTIVTILGIIAVIGPLLIIAGQIAGVVSAVVGAMTMLKTATMAQTIAQYGLNAALLANPITWVVIAIMALVVAFIVLWKRCEGFRNFWIGLGKAIVSIAKNVVDAIVGFFTKTIPNTFKSMKDGVSGTVGGLKNAVVNGLKGAIDWIKGLPKEALGWGKDMIDGLVNGIKSKISAVGNAVKDIGNKIKSFLHFSVPDEGPLTDYESWMPDFMEGLAKGIENSKNKVTSAIKGLSSDISLGMTLNPALSAGSKGTISSSNNNVNHTGTIRVEGVNDKKQLTAVVDIVLEELHKEARL